MPRIKRSSIENLRQRVSLLDVVSPYTQMKRAGAQFRGLSPFNAEKTPSFYVHPEKNVFYDYSSGSAGDLFRFVQLKENIEFYEAIELLAERFSVPLEYEEDGMPKERLSLRKELLTLHGVAADYFHRCFQADHEESTYIRDYWTGKRQFPLELAKQFKIGLAPKSGGKLLDLLHKEGYSPDAIRECGLFFVNDSDTSAQRARPRFRGRLMIPIRDVQGRVIAFTARQTDLTPEDDPAREAKYINSPETPLFKKGDVLFGLEEARKTVGEGQSIVLVEGQLGCLRCIEKGVGNAVAPQGTAITDGQMALLRRYTHRVDVLLDGDSAGQKGALRMLPLALKAGLDVRFLPLPEGTDPDTLLAEGGKAALDSLEAQALSWVQFAASRLVPVDTPPGSPEERGGLEQLFGIIVQSESAVIRDQSLAALALCLSRLDRLALQRDFERFQRGQRLERPSEPATDRAKHEATLTSAEGQLMLVCLHDEDLAHRIAGTVDLEWVETRSAEGRIFGMLITEFQDDAWSGISSFLELLDNEDDKNLVYTLKSRDSAADDLAEAATVALQALHRRHVQQQQKSLEQALINTPQGDTEKIRNIHQQRIELRQALSEPPNIRL